MSTHTHRHDPSLRNDEPSLFDSLIASRSRLTLALVLIALGGVFLFQQTGLIKTSNNWWVVFIAIPGVVAFGSAVIGYMQQNQLTRSVFAQGFFGLALLMLSGVFIWDPTWSFTRGWQLNETFAFLGGLSVLWPWLLVAGGLLLGYWGVQRTDTHLTSFGVIVMVVGFVFILNISWNVVWPLVLVAVGLWVLVNSPSAKDKS